MLRVVRDEDPDVKISTRVQAAIRVLELAGITVPKRVELSGPDGREIQIQAQAELRGLSDAQLVAIAAVVEGDSGRGD